MAQVKDIAKELLQSEQVQVVIGYAEGSSKRVRPIFVQKVEDVDQLVCDERCTSNLAVYLYKKETASLGKPAIVANIHTLRGIIRLATEKQLQKEDGLIAICVNEKGDVSVCKTLSEIEAYLADVTPKLSDEDKAMLDKLSAMSQEERWDFWKKEMENCIKCYACRQACPLCYCTQCTVEINQPQWIPVGATTLGNLEWHVMRGMHLSGRCIECGQCGEACPVNIPIHLLPMKLAEEVKNIYGTTTGMSRNEGCAMATYQPDDKENFIG